MALSRRARHVGRHVLSRCPEERPRGFDELRFYAERFNTVEMNSTFYGQPRAAVSLGWVRRTPAGLRVLGQALPEVHAPGHRALIPARSARFDVDAFKGGIEPLAAGRQARRAPRAVPIALSRHAGRARLSAWADADVRRLPTRGGAAPPLVERRGTAPRRALLAEGGAAWVQIDEPKFQSSIRHRRLMPNAGDHALRQAPRPQCGGMVGRTRSPRIATTTCIPRTRARTDNREAASGSRAGAEAVSLHEQPLRGAGGRQRHDGARDAGRAGDRADAIPSSWRILSSKAVHGPRRYL